MKKVMCFFLVGINLFALNLNVGLSVSEAYKRVNKVRTHQQEVYGINLELTHKFLVTEVGLGVTYEGRYKYKEKEFEAIPLYGLVKFNLTKNKISPYIVGKYGEIIFLEDDIKGKDFYSVGVGLKFYDKVQVELTHDVKIISGCKDQFGKNSLKISYNIM